MEPFYLCNSAALQAGLSKSAFKVYSFLAKCADRFTRASHYKKENIALNCHTSVSTVTRAIRELCRKGLLEVRKRFVGRRQTSNEYILLDNPQLNIGSIEPNTSKKEDTPSIHNNAKKVSQNGLQSKARLFRCNPACFQIKLSPNETKVYAYLSFRSGKDGQCKPSRKEIASDCGISVSTVTRAICQLSNSGLISIVSQTRQERYGNNGTSVNRYVLNKGISFAPTKNDTPHMQSSLELKLLFWFFLARLTPSPASPVTPHRTIARRKVTLKQRKEYFLSKLTKWYKANIYPKSPGKDLTTQVRTKSGNSG